MNQHEICLFAELKRQNVSRGIMDRCHQANSIPEITVIPARTRGTPNEGQSECHPLNGFLVERARPTL